MTTKVLLRAWVIFTKDGIVRTAKTKNKPTLKPGEAVIDLALSVPLALFDPPPMSALVEITDANLVSKVDLLALVNGKLPGPGDL